MKRLSMARLAVFSHKPCWRSVVTPGAVATDGGFPFQMRALSEVFDRTRVLVPVGDSARPGESVLEGPGMQVVPLTPPGGEGLARKLGFVWWFLRNLPVLLRETLAADAVHAPIPGDVGTVGMLLAFFFRKPLIVRHCGNWINQRTTAERFWKWFMERYAGGRNVMLATGGGVMPPSAKNGNIAWIFSSSMREAALRDHGAGNPRTASPNLIVVSRQERAKGTAVVIEALRILAPEMPGIHLDVAGSGAALDFFRQTAEHCGVADRVVFHGSVSHARVLELHRGASLFCFPTTSSEGFPKAVLEAMACGVPVIATPVSVLPSLLAGGGGILVEQASPELLADAIRRCLKDEAAYREMSCRAIETAAGFSLERWRDTIAAIASKSWGAYE